MGLIPGQLLLVRETAGTGRFLQFLTRCFHKVEYRLEITARLAERMTRHDDPRAAMSFSAMIEGEFDFGPFRKIPLGQKADALGAPVNLMLNKSDGIRKTNRYARALTSPGFAWYSHNQRQLCRLSLGNTE
jgi:hypothetical protein